MRVAVTGATGFLGRAICSKLAEAGHTIFPMAMKGEDTTGLENVFFGDITDPSDLSLPPCDAVVHCAGLLESSHPPVELLMKVNTKGTENVFLESRKAGASSFVFISSISALGPHGDISHPMMEDQRPDPDDDYGRSKLKAEQFLEEMSGKSNITITILRPSVLYGPGMNLDSSGMKTFTSIEKGIMPLVGKGETILNMLFVSNLVHAVELSIGRKGDLSLFHVSEGPYDQKRVIEEIERTMGRKGHRKIPKLLLWIFTLFFETFKFLFKGPPPLSWTKYRGLTSSGWNMSSSKIRDELGFREPVSLSDGIRITCDHYGWSKKK